MSVSFYKIPYEQKIYIYNLDDQQDLVDLAMDGIREIERDFPERTESNVKSKYMSPWNSHMINPKLMPLCNHVEKLIMEMSNLVYASDIKKLNVEFKITDCWYAKYENSDFTIRHSHYPADWSAVIYVNVDDNASSIIFEDKYSIQPTKNMLVIFPGYLYHEVPKTPGKRDVIAMNIFKKATFISHMQDKPKMEEIEQSPEIKELLSKLVQDAKSS